MDDKRFKRLEEIKSDMERDFGIIEENFYSLLPEKRIELIKDRFEVNVCEEEVSRAHTSRELLITIIALRLMERDPCPICNGFGKKDGKECPDCCGKGRYRIK